jgi:hypothetical protein
VVRLVCPGCRVTCERPANELLADDARCVSCGVEMVFVDPGAAAAEIARAARPRVERVGAWKTIRRELIIGLAWGTGLAGLVIYPLLVRGAYRDAEGRVVQNYVNRGQIIWSERMPVRFELGWGDWLLLVIQQCGPVVAIAGGIGLTVGLVKLGLSRRHSTSEMRNAPQNTNR